MTDIYNDLAIKRMGEVFEEMTQCFDFESACNEAQALSRHDLSLCFAINAAGVFQSLGSEIFSEHVKEISDRSSKPVAVCRTAEILLSDGFWRKAVLWEGKDGNTVIVAFWQRE